MSGTPATEHVHYVRGAGQAVAIVKRAAGTLQTRYLHRDHLGSVVALTDASGAVLERYSYDPWGKRRDAATWASPAPGTFPIDPAYSDRGYTGHEHIDHVGLINMNGRIYDPEIGRFLSADPTTQFPESTQGWNRYSYCGNNPLSYTDPSGFSFFKSLMKVVGVVLNFIPVVGTFASIAWYNAMLVGFAAGFLASGGNLQAGLLGGLGGALFGAIGGLDSLGTLQRALLHGLAGGAVNAIGGGQFQDGFLGAFAGAALSPGIEKTFGPAGTGGISGKVWRVASAAVIGGVSSALGGGKFKNGAMTAGFARLFNHEWHGRQYNTTPSGRIHIEDGAELSTGDIKQAMDEVAAKQAELSRAANDPSALRTSLPGIDKVEIVANVQLSAAQSSLGQIGAELAPGLIGPIGKAMYADLYPTLLGRLPMNAIAKYFPRAVPFLDAVGNLVTAMQGTQLVPISGHELQCSARQGCDLYFQK